MSTLWTPDGERPIRRSPPPGPSAAPQGGSAPEPGPEGGPDDGDVAAQLDQLREQLAHTPAALVVANHGFGLFELAALHLSLDPSASAVQWNG